jgi:hypothetical protein
MEVAQGIATMEGHLSDMAASYLPGVKWGEAAPAFDDEPAYRIAPEVGLQLSTLHAKSLSR